MSRLLAVTAICFTLVSSAVAQSPIGEWSGDCSEGVRINAMPNTWVLNPEQAPMSLVVRFAVDFRQLPESTWTASVDLKGEPVHNLIGYELMVYQAIVRDAEGKVVARLDGVSPGLRGPTLVDWDGRDSAGVALPDGDYEIEVKGRLLPKDRVQPSVLDYGSVEGLTGLIEGCTRPLRIEIDSSTTVKMAARGHCTTSAPASYWDSAIAVADDQVALRQAIHDIIDDHTALTYSANVHDVWDALDAADRNPSNDNELLTIYKNEGYATGCSSDCDWNREHTWASSYGFGSDEGDGHTPYTDAHHLRAANAGYNSARSNKPFNDCVGCATSYSTDLNNGVGGGNKDVNRTSGGATGTGSNPSATDIWQVWPHRRGDSARSMLYMDIRYEGDIATEPDLILTDNLSLMTVDAFNYQNPAYLGSLTTLLAWHAADFPNSDEVRRNSEVWCSQGNRNPFVDHPEWVDCVYSGICPRIPYLTGFTATDADPCADTGVDLAWSTISDWNDDCVSSCSHGFNVYANNVLLTAGGCASPISDENATGCNDDTATNDTTVSYRVEAFNDLGNDAKTGIELSSDEVDDGNPPTISALNTIAGSSTFTVSWDTHKKADSKLEWGTVSGVYTGSSTNATLSKDHTLEASSLAAFTSYFYRVCSTDGCGNPESCTTEQTISTQTFAGCGEPFVSELHYDNIGTDTGEGVEIAGPAGFDLQGWSLEFYNGTGGGWQSAPGDSGIVDLSNETFRVIDDEGGGTGALWFSILGIQNAGYIYPPDIFPGWDGFALVNDQGEVHQLLCYEGSFDILVGAAAGRRCEESFGGLFEETDQAIGDSMQLIGTGSELSDFTWTVPALGSPGDINSGQTLTECGVCDDLVVASQTISDVQSNDVCGDLDLGPDLVFSASADFSATVGGAIHFFNGFQIESGATISLTTP